MNDTLDQIRQDFQKDSNSAQTILDAENLHIKYLGRKGIINNLFTSLKDLTDKDRQNIGKRLNELKSEIEKALSQKKVELESIQKSHEEIIDTTIPGKRPDIGNLHPTTITIRSINAFFSYMGYSVYTGPEIETEEFNFRKLNLPPDHPARDLQDTLYIREPEWLLRTHTSSVEIRAMTSEKLPIRIVVPGKVYRNETSNVTNNSMFYQYEGLVVDQNVSMAHLKGTLVAFAKFLYGENVKTRFRAKYYPQVEPGAGMDIGCTFCDTEGCAVCKYRGFIEVLGAGMVHPNVLKACNIDSKKYSGFAFGMGLDRLVMLRFGITDIRKLYNGSLVVL